MRKIYYLLLSFLFASLASAHANVKIMPRPYLLTYFCGLAPLGIWHTPGMPLYSRYV